MAHELFTTLESSNKSEAPEVGAKPEEDRRPLARSSQLGKTAA
jgi:hypothetical protein